MFVHDGVEARRFEVRQLARLSLNSKRSDSILHDIIETSATKGVAEAEQIMFSTQTFDGLLINNNLTVNALYALDLFDFEVLILLIELKT